MNSIIVKGKPERTLSDFGLELGCLTTYVGDRRWGLGMVSFWFKIYGFLGLDNNQMPGPDFLILP